MNSFHILLTASGLASAGAAMSSSSLRILPCSPEVLLLGQRAFGPGGELLVGRHQGEPWARSAVASGTAPGRPGVWIQEMVTRGWAVEKREHTFYSQRKVTQKVFQNCRTLFESLPVF